ncbi:Uncharacterised protein [Mycobacteroides abscessus subsp. massiliense]|nr:Uncharacterised protein [Mycobacteroides abscessus subsp. massiliense]
MGREEAGGEHTDTDDHREQGVRDGQRKPGGRDDDRGDQNRTPAPAIRQPSGHRRRHGSGQVQQEEQTGNGRRQPERGCDKAIAQIVVYGDESTHEQKCQAEHDEQDRVS